jgi:hypothetical protein
MRRLFQAHPSALLLLLTFSLSLPSRFCRADGTFLAASLRTDMVHAYDTDILYVTNGTSVLRYVVGTKTFLPPISLSVNGDTPKLLGIDLSPDGKTLAVADNRTVGSLVWVWLIDTQTLQATRVTFPQAFYEGGTYTVAFGADGSLFVSATFQGSGSVPLRRYFPATNTTTVVHDRISQSTMLTPSGDAQIIGLAESNLSTGPVGRIRVSDGDYIRKDTYEGGTSWFNYEMGVNKDGSQFAVPTYNGAYIYNSAVVKTGTKIGTYAAQHPMGVVYHPVEDLVYFAWAKTYDIRCFNTLTWAQTASYYFENYFDHPGNAAFTEGRLKLSRDGSVLFSTVQGGVRFLKLYEGLAVQDSSVTVSEDTPTAAPLGGSIGNGGALSWTIDTPPAHGILSGEAPGVTYTPEPNYSGPDSFTYTVSYGRAFKTATVGITVTPDGEAPDAQDDSGASIDGAATTVVVLANDADPDGDALTVSAVTQGAKGSVAINTDGSVTYTPQSAFNGADSFTYTVDDGTGKTDTATVTIDCTFDTTGLLYSVSVSPSTVAGGLAAKGTVKLARTIAMPIEVNLSTTNPAAAVPPTVTIPGGSLSATFAISTSPVRVKTTGYVKAALGAAAKQAVINVRPVSVKSVTFAPSTVVGGRGTKGTVTLETPAAPGDIVVTLAPLASLVRVADVNGNLISSIVISAGSTTGVFYAQSDPVVVLTRVKVRAAANGLYKDGTLTLKPIPVASIKLWPTSVRGGMGSVATITLLDPAAPGDLTVTLSSTAPQTAWFVDEGGAAVGSVVVAAGTRSVNVGVQTAPVGAKTFVSLRAAAGGVTKSATLTVTP